MRHPTPEIAFDSLSRGLCLYSSISRCSGKLLSVGLRDRDDADRILVCSAHTTRLRKMHPRDRDSLGAHLNAAFGRPPEEAAF